MPNRYLSSTIQYEENCDYNSSIKYQDISFPLQEVNLKINAENYTDYSAENENLDQDIVQSLPSIIPCFLNEKLLITVIVTLGDNDEVTVTAGKVIFYYQYKDDSTGKWNQINTDPIKIDNYGEASVIFMPHGPGYIKVEYIGDEYYADKTLDNFPLELDTIPTKITFIPPDDDYPPHFVNPEDTITMSVYVNDINKNPVKHGLVTFLHYFTHNIDDPYDGIEKVIGNPVYLENGIGTITYSPMQVESIKQYIESGVGKYQNIFKNIELIRAVYNYNNTEYGVNWHYYKSHSDYTTISILRPSTISIAIEKQVDNELVPLDVNLGGVYTIQDNESFILSATITNEENEEVTTEDDNITFVIGDEEYTGTYTGNNRFEYTITNLPIGDYEIYAYVNNKQKFFTQEDITLNDENGTSIRDNQGNIIEVTDAKYLQSTESDYIYLEVTPATTHCTLNLTATSSYYTIDNTGVYDKSNLKVTFDIDTKDKPLLHEKTCYFVVSPSNQIYSGTIYYENGEVYAYPEKLNDIEITGISMTEVNNYTIRAYIQNGTYKYNNGIQEISKDLPTIFSNNVIIKARKQMNISFGDKKTINQYYPGSIKFFVKGENIYSDILNIRVFLDDNIASNIYQLTQTNSLIQCNIDNIEVGQHTLHAEVIDNDFNILPATTYSFNIEKNNLTSELNTTSIYAAIEQTIMLNIKSIYDNSIMDINENNLNITLLNPNNEEMTYTCVKNNENSSEKKIYYTLTTPLRQTGTWQILINYTEDNHYVMPTETLEFTVTNTDPVLMLEFDINHENELFGRITHDGDYNNNQALKLSLKFNYENADSITHDIITNENGSFSISRTDFSNTSKWDNWTSVTIIFDLEENEDSIGYNDYEKTIMRKEIGVKNEITESNI